MSKVLTPLLASSEELDTELEQGEERRLRMVISWLYVFTVFKMTRQRVF